jgi:hypothetical protein
MNGIYLSYDLNPSFLSTGNINMNVLPSRSRGKNIDFVMTNLYDHCQTQGNIIERTIYYHRCCLLLCKVQLVQTIWDQLFMGPTKYGTILFGPFKCRTNLLWDQQSLDVLPFLTDLSWSGVGSFTVCNCPSPLNPAGIGKSSTVKPRFTGPRFTVHLDLPCTISFPRFLPQNFKLYGMIRSKPIGG